MTDEKITVVDEKPVQEVKDNTQKKYKSVVMWSALAAQVMALLVIAGVVDVVKSEQIQLIIGLVLEILATVGILNNPNSKDSF